MRFSGHLRASAGTLVRLRVRTQLAKFMSQTRDCRGMQADVLASLLNLNRESRFSQEHGLARATSVEDLWQALPVTKYDFYRSAIEQLKLGDHAALLGPKNRLLMFSLSSGTTSDSKFIPVTSRFHSDYRRGWRLWGINAFDDYPALPRLRILQLCSDYHRFTTPGGTPCGNISGLAASMQGSAVNLLYTLPFALMKIDDPESKYYTALRIALADPEIGLMTTANPSTLVHLAQIADERKTELIRDLFDGSLTSECRLAPEVRSQLARVLSRKSQARARQLEACVESTGHLYPKDCWPDLNLVAVWTGGSCAAYLPALREYYGSVPVRDHGLSASEGRMTIPFQDETCDGVLDIASHFFEFIPENEYGSASPTILQAHELEADHNYYILLTTSSGFYRYDICDVVRCVGFQHTTPIIRFLHKGAHISNITGEKLSESQVVEGVRRTLEQFNHRVEFFTVIPAWGDPPGYRLLCEDWETPSSADTPNFEAALDQHLQSLNCEYQEKRATGRLAPIRLLALRNQSWEQFARDRQQKLGGSIEQYKHPCLLPDMQAAAAVVKRFGAMDVPQADTVESPG